MIVVSVGYRSHRAVTALSIWGSIGSSLIMMDLESKESYQIIFALDVVTGIAQILGVALLQYLAHNLHAENR